MIRFGFLEDEGDFVDDSIVHKQSYLISVLLKGQQMYNQLSSIQLVITSRTLTFIVVQ